MSLRLPSEIVVERFLPTARSMIAAELEALGLTQEEIASHLGVSQAAVSKYAGGQVATEPRFAEDPRMVETTERIAAGLADDEISEYEVLGALLDLVRTFEDRGPICELHEEAMPALAGLGCDLCVRGPDTDVQAERAALAAVRKAARMLTAAPGMASVVPNVGTNIGSAIPNPADVTDVAAIPGRIYAVGNRVEVPANPEFGASRHVAEMVLAANAVDPSIRGALNVATDDRLLAAAHDRGIAPLEFDAEYEDRRERLQARFEADATVPRVVYHRGAFGIEPVTYVFGETAVEAADLVVDLVAAADTGSDRDTDADTDTADRSK